MFCRVGPHLHTPVAQMRLITSTSNTPKWAEITCAAVCQCHGNGTRNSGHKCSVRLKWSASKLRREYTVALPSCDLNETVFSATRSNSLIILSRERRTSNCCFRPMTGTTFRETNDQIDARRRHVIRLFFCVTGFQGVNVLMINFQNIFLLLTAEA